MVGYVFRQRSLAWVAFDKIVTFCFCGLTQIPHPQFSSCMENSKKDGEFRDNNDKRHENHFAKKEKKKNDYEKKIIILSTDDDKCEWEEIETKNQQRYFCFERVTFH